MQYGWKGACAYLVVGLRLLALSMLRRFGVKAYDFDDGTALRAFALTLPFEPVTSVAPTGWRCEHVSISIGGGWMPTRPEVSCGCHMHPVLPERV
jgi:hypothetical protein